MLLNYGTFSYHPFLFPDFTDFSDFPDFPDFPDFTDFPDFLKKKIVKNDFFMITLKVRNFYSRYFINAAY